MMITTTSLTQPRDLILYLSDMTDVVTTGPVLGVWTTTAPDSVTQPVLDLAVASAAQTMLIEVNFDALTAKAKAALIVNATFLALAAPTNAQVLAQIKLLTRQVNALIKLRVQDLADTNGT